MIVGFLRVPRGAPVNTRASGETAVTVGQPDDEQPLAFMRRADFRRAEQTRRNVETQSSSGRIGNAFAAVGKAAAVAGAAVAAYGVKLAVDGVKAAIEDEQAQVKLAGSLQRVTQATDDQIAAVEKQITVTALATGVADDELRPALDRLTRSTKNIEQSQKLLNLALDISRGSGKSLESVTNAWMWASKCMAINIQQLAGNKIAFRRNCYRRSYTRSYHKCKCRSGIS